ncbi:tight adherence protein B [Amphibacillus marinus]|uniref:Tight adherence protein B n=1 Tax=Amphibacillus marinus TaxID=872970 RepID=A0A1H8R1W8_9BACI|nr:type II secretion system F family protein [Amphibacillus marinus]SEO60619.1 tight adherence protein B [Amphibacillus marinus]
MRLILVIGLALILTVGLIALSRKKKGRQPAKEPKQSKLFQAFQTKKVQKSGPTDYQTYYYTVAEYLFIAAVAGALLFVIGYVFYQSIIMSILFASVGLFFPKVYRQRMIQKRQNELSQQFQQALFSLSTSLVAGRSIENAFVEVVKDLSLIYPDPETLIIKELEIINKRVANREPIEIAIEDFSKRAGVEDITNFTDVFITCKRTGGDLVEVIRRTSTMISEKFEIQQEISVMVAQKKFESNAITLAPVLMVGVLSYSSAEYMKPLYSWADFGPIVMTISLAIILFSFWLCQRIMNIKV